MGNKRSKEVTIRSESSKRICIISRNSKSFIRSFHFLKISFIFIPIADIICVQCIAGMRMPLRNASNFVHLLNRKLHLEQRRCWTFGKFTDKSRDIFISNTIANSFQNFYTITTIQFLLCDTGHEVSWASTLILIFVEVSRISYRNVHNIIRTDHTLWSGINIFQRYMHSSY